MGWQSILTDWTGGTVLVAMALGCAGAEDPGQAGEAEPAGRRLIREIEPAKVVNRPPRFISLAPRMAREGEPYRYGIAAADPEGDAVRLTLVRAPEGAALEGSLLKWQPRHSQVGRAQRFTLRAVDEHGAAREQSWSVMPRAGARHGARPEPTHQR